MSLFFSLFKFFDFESKIWFVFMCKPQLYRFFYRFVFVIFVK